MTYEELKAAYEAAVQKCSELEKDGLAPTAFALRLNVTSRVLKNGVILKK